MSKLTIVLLALLGVTVSLLVIVVLHPLLPSSPLQSSLPFLPKTNTPRTILSISPQEIMPSASGSGQFSVRVNTKENTIGTVQLEIGYDPRIISVTSVKPGDFFTHRHILLNEIDNNYGRITFAMSTDDKEQSGIGNLATVNFWIRYPLLLNKAAFTFYPKTDVMHLGETQSLIATSSGAEVVFPILRLPRTTATSSGLIKGN